MDDDHDLRDFSNLVRLFPLPRVVHFPHAVVPLHIFEPRYRQMTEDALAGDKLIAIVQLLPPGMAQGLGTPPIADVACLGKILQHQRLPDGRFNLLLLGRKRVQLRHELEPGTRLYRQAKAKILEEEPCEATEVMLGQRLRDVFRQVFERHQELDPDLASLLDNSTVSLGVLTDIIAHALPLAIESKQALLAEPRVARRADELLDLLSRAAEAALPPHSFPPPFSVN